MKIQLKYFASVREALGQSDESVDVPEGIATLGDVRAWLRVRGGVWAETLAEGRALRMACNHVMTDADTRITDGCEVAFFPPVTGG
ncbi:MULTISPECIES: molybdopterin converting factor subunit 1 [Paraburkholderia]|jgi:molybdopterin synthase sulfur carrier subunit|uniref:molybdopterin converting factor subunit 1 n=1 Tax=Paraburkholderia TaxID=1822464 RepID=UPI001CAE977C|nr:MULTISPECIES: molybdopterin converting factor subunit 1 [Paraburkholderia]BEU21690.1 molybdopterin converting factor subunit 1 [Paraburkholderia sp. 22B1P]GJH00144.1 molybdopterin converting factor subunit 1 [Paraburkholderia terrae]GJH31511.1 molybdopterin converting factor subunit 1 [Paraburkholderia hospita]CAG9271986.1 Molybdenum cofactor biosynthesis protein D; Molybdopterin converting factor subunit 1 [Paraburkholderia caribensis]